MTTPLSQPYNALPTTVLCMHMVCRASDRCLRERRKTISGDDLLWAMGTVGFTDYVAPLQIYLAKYRDAEGVTGGGGGGSSRSGGGSKRI
jgi:nuclear transcription Y subunit beta